MSTAIMGAGFGVRANRFFGQIKEAANRGTIRMQRSVQKAISRRWRENNEIADRARHNQRKGYEQDFNINGLRLH